MDTSHLAILVLGIVTGIVANMVLSALLNALVQAVMEVLNSILQALKTLVVLIGSVVIALLAGWGLIALFLR